MIIDDSYTKILIKSSDGWYFRHTEHGGSIRDPLFADTETDFNIHLGNMMSAAIKQSPRSSWEYARLLIDVKPFSSQEMVHRLIAEDKKRVALAKLTSEERILLGLSNI